MEQKRVDDTDDTFVNYLPGGPTPSDGSGRVEGFLRTLLRRRGPITPVVPEDD